jgi:hypothetical protein
MRRLRERLTFGNVTASLALFIALGGTSYAAITLPRNSVGTNQLRTGAIRSVDVKDRSLEARDLSLKARRFLKGQKGERGERGPQGPAGGTGDPGTSGGGGGGTTTTTPAGITLTVKTASGSVTGSAETGDAVATCDAGQRVTGGGVRIDSGGGASQSESYPSGNNTSWTGVVSKDVNNATFTVFAICAS